MTYLNKEYRNTKRSDRVKLLALLVAVVLTCSLFVMCACNPQPVVPSYIPNEVFPTEFLGIAQGKPIYCTSFGQAIDIERAEISLNSLDIDYTLKKKLRVDEIPQGAIVFAVVGSSIKGLYESDVTKEEELARTQSFIDGAESGNYCLIALHIGGLNRRGETSDSFIKLIFGNCSLCLFYAEGNDDYLLSDCALSGNVPYCQFSSDVSLTNMFSLLTHGVAVV